MRSLFERPIQSGLFCETNPLGMAHSAGYTSTNWSGVIDAAWARASILEWCPNWFGPLQLFRSARSLYLRKRPPRTGDPEIAGAPLWASRVQSPVLSAFDPGRARAWGTALAGHGYPREFEQKTNFFRLGNKTGTYALARTSGVLRFRHSSLWDLGVRSTVMSERSPTGVEARQDLSPVFPAEIVDIFGHPPVVEHREP
jgi:hypothetical protein